MKLSAAARVLQGIVVAARKQTERATGAGGKQTEAETANCGIKSTCRVERALGG